MQSEIFDVLRGLLDHVDRNTCTHESTHRGGFLWTICDDCGMKWADDKGGFKPHADAPAVAKARAVLDAALSEQQAGEVKIKPLEWVGDGDCYAFADVTHQSYSIDFEEGKYWANWDMSLPPFDTLQAAKAAAQAVAEIVARSALVYVPAVEPVGDIEPVAWYMHLWNEADEEIKSDIRWGRPTSEDIARAEHNGHDIEYLYTRPPHREGEDSAEVERLTRPIVGIKHRTAQEVFDIMADRIRLAATRSGSATSPKGGAE